MTMLNINYKTPACCKSIDVKYIKIINYKLHNAPHGGSLKCLCTLVDSRLPQDNYDNAITINCKAKSVVHSGIAAIPSG